MRRLLTLTALGIVLALAGTASAGTTFLFRGHGYGHGVGLSQWGAYGCAKQGWTYDQILAHYYQGTTLGPAPVSRLRVLLAEGRSSVTISSNAPFAVRSGGERIPLPAGAVELGGSFTLLVGGQARTLTAPVRFEPGSAPLRFDRAYRGALVVYRIGGSLSVVNDVGLEQYVAAVVPHEMPASWHPEALKTQAVAARTYAIVASKPGPYFDFRADPVAQAYEGVEEEDARTTAAVEATRGQIVLFDGKPAWTFYSSSSGGRTAALTDVFQGGAGYPYLQSVEDECDRSVSPYRNWGPVAVDASDLATRLGLPGPPERLTLRRAPSGRVLALVARASGWKREVPGPTVRTALGLRSTWFRVTKQPASPPAARVARHR